MLDGGQQVLTIIFGAGASHGSAIIDPSTGVETFLGVQRPPLTSGLFDNAEIQRKYKMVWPQLSGLIPQLHGQPDLESTLEAIARQAEATPDWGRVSSQLRALRFYLRDVIRDISKLWWEASGGVDAYTGLLWQVEAWRAEVGGTVNLVTFNYDPLLEWAFASCISPGVDADIDSYITRDDYRIYKLHGSVTWLVELVHDWVPGDDAHGHTAISNALQIKPSDVVRIDNRPQGLAIQGARLTMPAITVPTLGKEKFACPKTHTQDLIERLRGSDYILTIGWRGRDKGFINLLGSTRSAQPPRVMQPRVLCIDPSLGQAMDLERQLHLLINYDDDHQPRPSTFARAIYEGIIADWLGVAHRLAPTT